MPKIRTLKATYFQDTKLAEIDIAGRYVFAGILCSMCDDDGIFQANPKLIKGLILPFDDKIKPKHIYDWLKKIQELGIIIPFWYNDTSYFQVANWYKHQRVPAEKYYPSVVPEGIRPVASGMPQGSRKAAAGVLGIGKGIRNKEKEIEKEQEKDSGVDTPPPETVFSDFTESNLSPSNSEKAQTPIAEKKTLPRGKQAGKMMPQSVDEVIKFAAEKYPAANVNQCNDFFDSMTARAWIVSGKPVKDWQATFRVWLNKGWLKPNYGENAAIKQERPLTAWQQRQEEKAIVTRPAVQDDDIPW